MNSLQAELIDDDGGYAHYKILTVIGNCQRLLDAFWLMNYCEIETFILI